MAPAAESRTRSAVLRRLSPDVLLVVERSPKTLIAGVILAVMGALLLPTTSLAMLFFPPAVFLWMARYRVRFDRGRSEVLATWGISLHPLWKMQRPLANYRTVVITRRIRSKGDDEPGFILYYVLKVCCEEEPHELAFMKANHEIAKAISSSLLDAMSKGIAAQNRRGLHERERRRTRTEPALELDFANLDEVRRAATEMAGFLGLRLIDATLPA